MKIKAIRLKNFQSHKDTVVELSPKLNCITGSWHSGKSSLVRALAFLFYNEWYPCYHRFDEDNTEITITLEDGSTVTRIKGEGVNKVIVNGIVFENFGNTLPEEVSNILGIFPLQIDVDQYINLNVSEQDDGLFLLQERGPYRAKVLNRVFGISLIDAALRDLNRDKKQSMIDLQDKKQEIKQLQKELEPFEMLLKDKEKILEAETLIDKVEKLKKNLEALGIYTTKLKEGDEKVKLLKVKEEELKQQLEAKYEGLAAMDVCPFCENPLEKGKAQELIERYK